MRLSLAIAIVCTLTASARAELDPKRKVVVIEYRAGSSALPKVVGQLVAEMSKQTSLQVLGPDQTKALYGEQLDQAIVKCAGEADCVAKIGARVGAAEVVLVGISELGDVILTMQRIDVRTHAVNARIAESLPADSPPTSDQFAYYLTKLLPPSDFLRFGIIAITSNESGASVTVGGEKRGVTPIEPLKLRAPAKYPIRIDKPGFVPFTTTVQLPPDSELKVEAELSRRGGGSHWYEKWYFYAGVVAVIGIAGAGTYYATREPPDSVPVGGVFK
ncbi:MAG TPA: PEGA domain-containing protein [Kofleriaceae bacterium]